MVPFGDDNARRSWNSGAYVYDGTGNITKIGSAWFTHDKVNRLTAITGFNGRNTPTTAATNHLTTGTYDDAGNLTNWNQTRYEYDRFNQMVRMTTPGGEDWAYVYTADDERIWSYNLVANVSNWTLRDLSGQLLREYANESPSEKRQRRSTRTGRG